MKELNGLPIYEIALGDSDIGIYATSIVDAPAIKSNFLKFNEDKPQFKFVDEEEKREIVGAFMIPDTPIYRRVGDMEFYVQFPGQVVRELVSKMLKDGMSGIFTIQHSIEAQNDAVVPMEIWIKDSDEDKSVALGFNEPDGTAFMRAKINDDNLWNFIKENDLNGFSIELDASITETFADIEKKEENEPIKEEPKNEKSMIEQMFSSHIEVNGTKLYFADELKQGAALFHEVEGVPTAYTGEFMKDDNKYKVENGLVIEVENIQLSTDEKISAIRTEITGLVDKLNTLFAKEEELVAKEEDLVLREKQLEEKFKQIEEGGVTKPEPMGFDAVKKARLEFAKQDWIKKFNKK